MRLEVKSDITLAGKLIHWNWHTYFDKI